MPDQREREREREASDLEGGTLRIQGTTRLDLSMVPDTASPTVFREKSFS